MEIILSPFRSGVYSIMLSESTGKYYFNFPTLLQARNALNKLDTRNYKNRHEALKNLCGNDYYSPELESFFQSKGNHPSSISISSYSG